MLIYGTGFETNSFVAPMKITGANGQTLSDVWSQRGPSAYLGMTVPGFPNMFMCYGPNTNLGHNSIIFMIEVPIPHRHPIPPSLSFGSACLTDSYGVCSGRVLMRCRRSYLTVFMFHSAIPFRVPCVYKCQVGHFLGLIQDLMGQTVCKHQTDYHESKRTFFIRLVLSFGSDFIHLIHLQGRNR